MTLPRVRWAALALMLAVLSLPFSLARAGAGADPAAASTVARIVVVGVPGLRWEDVSAAGTPELWAASDEGSIGALTVRSTRSTTCVLDGWVTLGSGNRARFVEPPSDLDEDSEPLPGGPTAAPGCLAQERGINLSAVTAALDDSPDALDGNAFGAEPGLLGASVPCSVGVGQGTVLALHRGASNVRLEPLPPTSPGGWADLVSLCPLTVVAMPELVGATDRSSALTALDARLAVLRAGLPADAELIVVGTSEVGVEGSALHVAIDIGPDVGRGLLTSASTGRTPFVQLIDVAPTVLDRLGLPTPSAMVGQVLQGGRPRAAELTDAVAELVAVDRAARAQASLTLTFPLLVGLMATLCLVGVPVVLAAPDGPAGRRARRGVAVVGMLAASLPVAILLTNLLPWWRVSPPGLAVTGLAAVGMAAVAVLAGAGPWRRRRLGPAAVVAVLTALVLSADVLTGSRLQLSNPLGYSPIVAGRFTGFGNIPFGIYAAAALLTVTALLAGTPPRHRLRVLVLAAIVVVGLDGTPALGNDVGGVLALVPAFVVFALVVLGIRPSVGRLAAAGVAGAVVVGAIAVLDYLRPPEARTHFGRFVGQLLDGSAGTIVQRKADSNIGLLVSSPLSILLPIFAVTLWLLLRRGGPLHDLLADPVLRGGLAAVGVAELVGFAVNDSGVAVPVAGGWLVVPLALALAAGVNRSSAAPGRLRDVRHAAAVTVNSRDTAVPPD